MTAVFAPPLRLPDYWTPEQALAAFELIDLLRDHLCAVYGTDIHDAYRDEYQQHDPRQLDLELESDVPF
jgi:hypothetical protein